MDFRPELHHNRIETPEPDGLTDKEATSMAAMCLVLVAAVALYAYFQRPKRR